MAKEPTVDRQLEFPFMMIVRANSVGTAQYDEDDLIAMFEGADLAWVQLLFVTSWTEGETEVMIFKDMNLNLHLRAERKVNTKKITNEITRCIESSTFGPMFETQLVELPFVKLENDQWVYL